MKMNSKLSYYTLFTEYLNSANSSVVYSTRSGKAYSIPHMTRVKLENQNFSDIDPQLLQELMDGKIVVPKDEIELETISNENKEYISNDKTFYEVIQPSANCQFGCDYCGQDHRKVSIKKNVYEKLLLRIRKKASSGSFEHLSIGWFGGEPLMAIKEMRHLTKELKQIAADNGMTYDAKVVSNALSLKENIFFELANELHVTSIEVTLDGAKEFHDARRHLKNGGSTFDLIIKNLDSIFQNEAYRSSNCSISLRCNVDERNCDGVIPLIDFLSARKYQDFISHFYTVGVYSWGGNDAHKKSLTKEEYALLEIDWMIYMVEKGFKPGLIPNRKKQVCMAVDKNSDMYDAYGNIFSCTEVSYTDVYENTEYHDGNLIFEPDINDVQRPLDNWNDVIKQDKFPCTKCKMLPVCGGGCPKAWYEDLLPCPSAKFNIKERLALAYVLSKMEKEQFSQLVLN